jgi:hypothetical protein
MAEQKRYFLGQDNSGHDYLVDASCRDQWNAWCAMDEDDPCSWETPPYAKRLNSSPELLTFRDPREP